MSIRRDWNTSSLSLLLVLASVAAADTVTLRPARSDGADYTIEGTIVDYTGDELTLQQNGRPRKYPADRVVRFETVWSETYSAAKQSLAKKQWANAARELTAAQRDERRVWVRRLILTDLLRCRLATGQVREAGELLIALDASDPATPAWSAAPLPWFASDAVSPTVAQAWLDRPEVAARLLGAAWLLNTTERARAAAELRSLARSPQKTISLLAETQLWRLSIARADARQTDRWAKRIAAMPEALRAGPQHLLAQAYLSQKRYDEAALMALEAPLTDKAAHRLGARGLVLAGRALRAAGQENEARRLFNEVIRDYADTPQKQDAAAWLAQ